MERKSLTYLFLIVILGAILRLSFITYSPPSLNWDEVSHGYNAYSILKTGMDQWSQRFPVLNFRAYGDYPTTLNLYLTTPFILIFGLTEFAIRFPHALLGILTIVSVYFLAFGVTKKRNISLFSAFLVATGPWYFFTSRFVLQSNLSVFLLISAAACFVNRDKKKFLFPLSLLLFTLTLFSYHTTRIFSPLFLVGSIWMYRDEIKNRLIYVFAALFLILSAYILVNPNATARGNLLFIVDQSAVNQIEGSRTSSSLPGLVNRLIYNRPVYFIEQFSKNYISYFSPQFLFFSGGTQYQFSVPNFGLINPATLLFFYIGLALIIFKAFRDKNYRLLSLWLILSPIPASITNESFAVVRATTMLPIPEIMISIGFYWLVYKVKSSFRTIIMIIFLACYYIFLENYLINYFTFYRINYSWSWQYGYEQVVNYAKEHYSEYDKIITTKKYGEPHEYFLFYLSYDPAKYQNDLSKIAFYKSNWYWVDRFDKFYFVNDWQVKEMKLESRGMIDCTNQRCLLITSPGNYPKGWKKIKTINFLDGKPAFDILNNE